MKKLVTALSVALFSITAFAAELFPDGKPNADLKGKQLDSAATIGGYALYKGDGHWVVTELHVAETGTLGNAAAVKIGTAVFAQLGVNGDTPAIMVVSANLTGAPPNQYMTGEPCAGSHIAKVQKVSGKDDNCMKIDAERHGEAGKETTYLVTSSVQNKSNGRSYRMRVFLSAESYGLGKTVESDWTESAIEKNLKRKAFVAQLKGWAERLGVASERVLDFSKPQDAFDEVPPLNSLSVSAVSE